MLQVIYRRWGGHVIGRKGVDVVDVSHVLGEGGGVVGHVHVSGVVGEGGEITAVVGVRGGE